jgi:hypothetical protein
MQDGHCGSLQCPIYSRPVEITTLPTTRPSTSASAHQICGNRTISPCFLVQPKKTATCLRLWQRGRLVSFHGSHLPGAMAKSRHHPRLLTHRYTSTVLLLLGFCVSLDCCMQRISRHRRQWLLVCLLGREQFGFFDRGMGHIAYTPLLCITPCLVIVQFRIELRRIFCPVLLTGEYTLLPMR